ncbi:MAG: hypothetical protein KY468_05225 [Armatimonadetes bacterium]|nr:hypothetical protein [Armatimonadota bacterium]
MRRLRSYFLLPVSGSKEDQSRNPIIQRIQKSIRKSEDARQISDVYVLSHGWHRNFFSAISAYDRLMSRFAILLHSGRLEANSDFRPLFINVHWHSDPGVNGWVDKSGRRLKESFMENVERRFERSPAQKKFKEDFEKFYDLFSEISAPAQKGMDIQKWIDEKATELTDSLKKYPLRDSNKKETLADKVSAVWTCYFEAQAQKMLVDQRQVGRRFLRSREAAWNFVRFIAGIVGTSALLGLLLGGKIPLGSSLLNLIAEGWASTVRFYGELFVLQTPLWDRLAVWVGNAVLLSLLALAATCVLFLSGFQQPSKRRDSSVGDRPRRESLHEEQREKEDQENWQQEMGSRGLLPLTAVCWLYLQLLCVLPLLSVCAITYFLAPSVIWAVKKLPRTFNLMDERRGERDEAPEGTKGGWFLLGLSIMARTPIRMTRKATNADSFLTPLLDSIDSQLAFWEMQRNGVKAAEEAANVLRELVEATPELQGKDTRFHFIGHSFGGLVVSNLARELALRPFKGTIQSVCLLQAAIASNWFEGEKQVRQAVKGKIANLYSRYDTANGFYYPLANHGRMAAGHVGLLPVEAVKSDYQDDMIPEMRGRYATLVTPPNLDFTPEGEPITSPDGNARILNLDASRLIYDGPVATGGGHGDIFKDDIIFLVWSATRIGEPPHRAGVIAQPEFGTEDPPAYKGRSPLDGPKPVGSLSMEEPEITERINTAEPPLKGLPTADREPDTDAEEVAEP